eukprot:scaffold5805_cov245-Ochromonas_danica.AAC.1
MGFDGLRQSLSQTLANEVTARTLCCRSVTLAITARYITQGQQYVNMIVVSSDLTAGENVSLSLFLVHNDSIWEKDSLFPPIISLQASTAAYFSITTANSGRVGVVSIEASLSGTDASNYQVVFKEDQSTITIHPAQKRVALRSPLPLYAVFSEDGLYILIKFDAASDKGGIASTVFACSRLISSIHGQCSWKDETVLDIILPPNSDLWPGSTVKLLPGMIRAKCLELNCTFYPANTVASLVIMSPPIKVIPTPVLVSTELHSLCASLVLDISNSAGSGNRPWKTQLFYVTFSPSNMSFSNQTLSNRTNARSSNISDIEAYLNDNASWVFGVATIPSAYISALSIDGGCLTVLVTLCNFLDACGHASKSIILTHWTSPSVAIVGSEIRTVSFSSTLNIEADAFVVSCEGGVDRQYLSYSWSVIDVTTASPISISSTSLRKNIFSAPANMLAVNKWYQISLSVVDTLSNRVNQVNARVLIVPASIVAVINGGGIKAIQEVGRTYILDASASYDEGSKETALFFTWYCFQLYPSISITCPFVSSNSTSWSGSSWSLYLPYDSVNKTARIALVVTSSDGRRASAIVDVQAVSNSSSNLMLESLSSVSRQFIVADKVQMKATLLSADWSSIYWRVNDSSVDLQTCASTPVNWTFDSEARSAISSLNYNLVLHPHCFSYGGVYTLTLAMFSSSTLSGSAAITFLVNSNPSPGVFMVYPLEGIELSTTFIFSALHWNDDDLPLKFSYGFFSNSQFNGESSDNTFQLMSTASEGTSEQFCLPRGSQFSSGQDLLSSSDGKPILWTVLFVYDALGGKSSETLEVTVWPNENLTTGGIESYLDAIFTSNASTFDDYYAALSVTSEALNSANCTAAPNCSYLHRQSCFEVDNTCGTCLIGFIGEEGVANSPCYFYSTPSGANGESRAMSGGMSSKIKHEGRYRFDGNRNRSSIFPSPLYSRLFSSVSCSDDDDCAFFEQCNGSGICEHIKKACPNNCSGHGSCYSYKKYFPEMGSQEYLCDVEDDQCAVECICTEGYVGKDCSLTLYNMTHRISSRLLMLGKLSNLTSSDDLSIESLMAWTSSLSSVTRSDDELNITSLLMARELIGKILNSLDSLVAISPSLQRSNAISATVMYDQPDASILFSINQVLQALTNEPTLVSLGVGDELSTAMVDYLMYVMYLVSSDMLAGEESISFLQNMFQAEASIIDNQDWSSSSEAVVIKMRRSGWDIYSNTSLPSLKMKISAWNNTSDAFHVGLLVLNMLRSDRNAMIAFKETPMVMLTTLFFFQLEKGLCFISESGNSSISNRGSPAEKGDGCQIDAVIPYLQNTRFLQKPSFLPHFEVYCPDHKSGMKSTGEWNVSFTCPQGLTLTIACNESMTQALNATCPFIEESPLCEVVGGSFGLSQNCYVKSFDEVETTCRCLLFDLENLPNSSYGGLNASLSTVFLGLQVSKTSVFSSAQITIISSDDEKQSDGISSNFPLLVAIVLPSAALVIGLIGMASLVLRRRKKKSDELCLVDLQSEYEKIQNLKAQNDGKREALQLDKLIFSSALQSWTHLAYMRKDTEKLKTLERLLVNDNQTLDSLLALHQSYLRLGVTEMTSESFLHHRLASALLTSFQLDNTLGLVDFGGLAVEHLEEHQGNGEEAKTLDDKLLSIAWLPIAAPVEGPQEVWFDFDDVYIDEDEIFYGINPLRSHLGDFRPSISPLACRRSQSIKLCTTSSLTDAEETRGLIRVEDSEDIADVAMSRPALVHLFEPIISIPHPASTVGRRPSLAFQEAFLRPRNQSDMETLLSTVSEIIGPELEQPEVVKSNNTESSEQQLHEDHYPAEARVSTITHDVKEDTTIITDPERVEWTEREEELLSSRTSHPNPSLPESAAPVEASVVQPR